MSLLACVPRRRRRRRRRRRKVCLSADGFFSSSVRLQMLRPSALDEYPAFSVVAGRARDHHPPDGLTPEKREGPFIRDPRVAAPGVGDFMLL